ALTASEVSRISPGFIGVTVMAIGTDLPEVANSVISALTGHGDVLVGDASGSALTQVTVVLAILCLGAGTLWGESGRLAAIALASVAALGLVAFLVRDQVLGRLEGALMCGLWVLGLVVMGRTGRDAPTLDVGLQRGALLPVIRTIGWLAVVGVAAIVVVASFVELSDAIGVPELVASAVVLSLGTSLPELVVDWTAIRRGSTALALGDLFGSSFLDATLTMGIGPSLRAVTVSSGASAACLIAAAGIAVVALVVGTRRRYGRGTAVVLLVVYGVGIGALITLAA
ncbi:MAG: sodium:calcium antiporter, partial [Ilumatobacteraceae bacterium]